ncbi:MAG: Rpp14/Pop5 family protein [Candidatus Odinarchaeia archaeon]
MVKYERRRYLAFKIWGAPSLTKESLIKSVWSSLINLFGDYGASKVSFWVINFDPEKRTGLFQCTNKSVNHLKAAIAMITSINGEPLIIQSLGVSGTIKAATRKYLS